MRTAVVVRGVPSPNGTGSSLTGWSVSKSLVEAGHQVTVMSLVNGDGHAEQLDAVRALGAGIEAVPLPEEPFSRLGLLRGSLWPKTASFIDSMPASADLTRRLVDLAPDAVFAYHFDALAPLAGMNGIPRMAPCLAIVGDPVHLPVLHRWRYAPKRPVARYALRTWMMLMALLRLPRLQRQWLMACQARGAFAAHHAEEFRKQGVAGCGYFHTPVVDAIGGRWEEERRSAPRRGKPKLMLVGHLHGIATLTGLEFFASRVLPVLERRLGPDGFEAHIVGRYEPPPGLAKRLDRPSVRLRGFVDDIDSEFLSADVLLVPTPIRLGIRARILTGFTYGCCVVAHSNNALGIPELEHGENALLAGSGAAMADEVVRALEDPELRRRLGARARETYERHFTLQAAGHPIVAEVERIASEGVAA